MGKNRVFWFILAMFVCFCMMSCGRADDSPLDPNETMNTDDLNASEEEDTTTANVAETKEATDATETTKIEEPIAPIPYFDRMKNNIPSAENARKVEVGMTMREVINLIGYPHGTANTKLYWVTDTEECFTVSLENSTTENFDEQKYEGIVREVRFLSTSTGYYDRLQTHRPTEEDILKIKNGMLMEEIYEIVGYPHNTTPHGILTVYWETDTGKRLVLSIGSTEDTCDEECTHPTEMPSWMMYVYHGAAMQVRIEEIPQYAVYRD